MEAFLITTGQHLSSFLNLLLMKRMDTGDRMLDTTLQMLLSTLIGGFITGLVTVYSKGMWGELRNRARALWSTSDYDPLRFDPRLAPEKPANGANYLYRACWECTRWPTFMSWFFTYHEDKQFTQKLERSIYIPTPTAPDGDHYRNSDDDPKDANKKTPEFNLLDKSFITRSPGVRRFTIPSSVFMPIWRAKNGFYVFVNTDGDSVDDEGIYLFSDSAAAVRECLDHINKHHGKMEEYATGLKSKGAGHGHEIMEFMPSGDYFTRGNTINKKKTFDTLFFTQKGETLRMLRAFKEGRLFAAHMPIDNKLGFLLYGPPGTGKTGFIAAVSNYLDRDVIYVDTSRIKTRKVFDSIMDMDAKKYIFIFEEFDTMPGVGRRPNEEEEESGASPTTPGGTGGAAEAPDMTQVAMMLMAGGKKEGGGGDIMDELREERKAAADKLDLGYLLRKLDGLESGEGRIIIATTNHPERIDPALLRPGRFGFQLHLTRCTGQMLVEMVRMIYSGPPAAFAAGEGAEGDEEAVNPERWEKVEEQLRRVDDGKWAPAEVLQLGVMLGSPEEMAAHLLEKEPACFR